jgi:hypothetical protein
LGHRGRPPRRDRGGPLGHGATTVALAGRHHRIRPPRWPCRAIPQAPRRATWSAVTYSYRSVGPGRVPVCAHLDSPRACAPEPRGPVRAARGSGTRTRIERSSMARSSSQHRSGSRARQFGATRLEVGCQRSTPVGSVDATSG